MLRSKRPHRSSVPSIAIESPCRHPRGFRTENHPSRGNVLNWFCISLLFHTTLGSPSSSSPEVFSNALPRLYPDERNTESPETMGSAALHPNVVSQRCRQSSFSCFDFNTNVRSRRSKYDRRFTILLERDHRRIPGVFVSGFPQ